MLTASGKRISSNVALAILALLVAACFVAPATAHATFRDVTDSFPASQDLGEYGAPINGSQLPDGNYLIGARTSSRMCIMYLNPEDAEARDSKEQAVLSVSGGEMTAIFYISKAYNYLYMGTQEEAAEATDEEGTDASAYIAGDPAEGYVPHLFALPVSELNVPMTISTFSGGDRGIDGGKWYTREFVFTMTEAELQSYIQPVEEPAPVVEEAPPAEQETVESNFETGDELGLGDGSADEAEAEAAAPPEPEPVAEEAPPAAQPQVPDKKVVRATRMRIVDPADTGSLPLLDADVPDTEKRDRPFEVPVLPLALVGTFAVGIGARAAMFAHSYESAANPQAHSAETTAMGDSS